MCAYNVVRHWRARDSRLLLVLLEALNNIEWAGSVDLS
jgi:hypothetical protein